MKFEMKNQFYSLLVLHIFVFHLFNNVEYVYVKTTVQAENV